MQVQIRWMILALLVMSLAASFTSASSASGEVPARVAGHVRGRLLEIKADRPRLQPSIPDSRGELANEFWNRAAGAIMLDETLKRQIAVDESRLNQLAEELATSHFKSLDASGVPRQALYAQSRELNQNLHRALERWKQDAQAGDALAKELGLTETSWQWLKYHHTQPQVIQGIEQGMNYGDEQIRQDALTNARRRLLQEGLIQSVVSEHHRPADYPKQYAHVRSQILARGAELHRQQAGIIDTPLELLPIQVPGSSKLIYPKQNGMTLVFREIPLIVNPGNSALGSYSENYLMTALMAADMNLSDQGWSPLSPEVMQPFEPMLGFAQYKLIFKTAAEEMISITPLTAQELAQLEKAWQRHVFSKWLVQQLRSDVRLDPDSAWALWLALK